MTQTIIGVFDTFQDAEFAQTRLEADGIARTDMRVHSNDERSTLSTDSTVDGAAAGRPAGEFHEGAMARIEHFFKNLFGDSDRPAEVGHYQEAVRRGGALLSVDVANEAETDRVRDVRHDVLYKHVIYSGPIDEYFDFCFGPLPYRSLRFVHETLDIPHFQPVAVVNYPDETVEYTRITEYKHLTGQSALQNQRPSLRLRLPDGDRQAAIGVPRPDKVGYACSGSSMTRRKKPTNLSCA